MVSELRTRLPELERTPSLKERAYESIKHCILYDLSSDDPLSVEELANQLGISRTPVREALLVLEMEGLVYSIPNRGTYVAAPTVGEVVDIYQVRAALEALAARLAASVIPNEELQRLKNDFDSAQGAIEQGNFEPYFQSDMDLHRAIRQYAGNEVLAQLIENLDDRLHRIRTYARRRSRQHLIQSFEEHREVLRALIERDPCQVARVMERHLDSASKRIEQILRSEASV